MMSRNGIATISHYLCFKSGYTAEELKQTGLKQVVDEEKYALLQNKGPYANVAKKVFTNPVTGDSKGAFPQSHKIQQIRDTMAKQKELEKKMNRWPGQGYEYVENKLFEYGPTGGRRQKGEMFVP